MNDKLKKFRTWINKNDGSYFQVDNQNFNLWQVTGFLLVISAFIVYLLHDKMGFSSTWLGWVFLLAGFILLFIGHTRKPNE
ncbi:hypothetical protein [uncultured Cocleimonas sp.]|uniref:hypothetical protein n=1 Tax=uncultured Cocleimonas sp. TaxID=1051587 RepID=UPI002617D208|nr:hypothetical protein [uncultured Cocleimonas sp.]